VRASGHGEKPLARYTVGLGSYLLLLMALQALGQHSFGALSPFIRSDLGASGAEIGLMGAGLYLGTAAAAFLLGGWVDRRSPGAVTLVTGLGVAAALVVVGTAQVVAAVVIGYLFVGLSRGAIPPLGDRVAYEAAPLRSRGFVFGLKQTGTPIGSVLAAMALPPLATTTLGWRGAVLIAAAAIAVVIAGSRGLLAFVTPPGYGTRQTDAQGAAAPASRSLGGGLLRRLWGVTIYSFGLGIFMSCAISFLTLYLVDAGGLDNVRAARWFAVFGVGGALGRVVWGWLSDRLQGRRAVLLLLSATLGGGMAIVLGLAPPLFLAVPGGLAMGLFGFVGQSWVGVLRALGAEIAGPGSSGRAGGLLLGAMMTGGLVGPPLFGWLADTTDSYATGWVLVGALAALTGLTMLPAMRRERLATG